MPAITADIAHQVALTHCKLGDAQSVRGDFDTAIASYRHALALAPELARAHNNLGSALWRSGHRDAAIASYQRAVELRPAYGLAHCNLGSALFHLHRLDEAAACYERALALMPGHVDALGDLGAIALRQGRYEEAIHRCREAIAANADYANAHWNLSLALLVLGHFEEGWLEHEWRWRTEEPVAHVREFAPPRWDGAPMTGQTLLLHSEQGLGDAIQFFRYLPLVRERAQARRIVLECQPPLVRLFAQCAGGDVEVIARTGWSQEGLPPFDRHAPLLSLPLILGRFEPLPMSTPYLRANSGERLPGNFRVGLAWSGSPRHKLDRFRSIAIEKLAPLLCVPGVQFFSLQIGACADGMTDFTTRLADFADTTALIAELDLVITVDTAVAHLAGALGKRVWTLLPFVPDWRWGLGRDDSPWYPTMRLFRQRTDGDWDEVVQRVAAELDAMR